jgi:hypothetical protein
MKYCRMGEIPNNYEKQLRNTERGRHIMRNTVDNHHRLRQEHDVLLKEVKEKSNEKAMQVKSLLILAWNWPSINGEIQHYRDITRKVNSFS